MSPQYTPQDVRGIYQDPWSYLDYKETFTFQPSAVRNTLLPPSWVGHHWRRLLAYTFLDKYFTNNAKDVINSNTLEEDRLEHREYGDPGLLVQVTMSSLIGNDQTVLVDDAADEGAPPGIDLEGEAEGPPEDLGPLTQQQTKLAQWMKDERFKIKMIEAERTCIKCGDTVYVLGWDEDRKRARLKVYNPGFYFPVLDPLGGPEDDEYPNKVHFAWEYNKTDEDRYVYRMTYERRRVPGAAFEFDWNDSPTEWMVFRKTMEWKMGDVDGVSPDDLSEKNAVVLEEERPLNIDFMPIVHIPNTVAEDDHYGTALISTVLQVIDDLQATDSDLQAASATTGTPPIVTKGAGAIRTQEDGTVLSYGPGTVLSTENGADMIDTSRSLDALIKFDDALKERLGVNARVPDTLIGRVDPSKVPSGIVMTLSFQPHTSMIREMRLIRDNKYDLLFKFVSRFMLADGQIETVGDAHLKFGSYLPADKQEVSGMVANLLNAHAISLETGMQMLIEAGMPVVDASQELLRIQRQNYAAAGELMSATNDPNIVRKFLGLPEIDLATLAGAAGAGTGTETGAGGTAGGPPATGQPGAAGGNGQLPEGIDITLLQ